MNPFFKRFGLSLISSYNLSKPEGKIRAISTGYKILVVAVTLGSYRLYQERFNKVFIAEEEGRELLEKRKTSSTDN